MKKYIIVMKNIVLHFEWLFIIRTISFNNICNKIEVEVKYFINRIKYKKYKIAKVFIVFKYS